jgi:DNA-binding XRE family transcriptional regulator
MDPTLPTFEAGGTTFVVVPASLAAKHGILADEAGERRRKLGGKLRRARERAELTQAQLGKLLGCGQSAVSAVEHGRDPCSESRAAAWLEACSTAKGAKA